MIVNKKRPWLLLELGLIFFLVGLDQWGKWWFQMRDMVVENQGGVLGIFPEFFWLGLLMIVWVILLIHWLNQTNRWYRLGLLLILAGGLSNLIDRLFFGYVRDYIYYPGWGFYGNVADILLGLGVAIGIGHGLLLQYWPWKRLQTP